MCGIAGVFGLSDERAVRTMLDRMRHRGPDDLGCVVIPEAPATLGNTRLSILDLSSAGHQPMSFADGKYWIVYNGEVYNFRDLRTRLRDLGCVFTTDTDTEVVVAAYAQWGIRCLDVFRGMFAFGLLDLSNPGNPVLVLARDRLGIKPLYYFRKGNTIWFASEVGPLIAGAAVPKTLDRDAIQDYLAMGSVRQPRSIYENTRMLPAGHYMIAASDDGGDPVRYWDLHEATTATRREVADMSFDDATREVGRLADESARLCTVSDRPIGIFLSGGLDSSVAAALVTRSTSQRVKAFHVCFPNHSDERQYARLAAERIGVDYQELEIPRHDVHGMFDRYVASLDQPSADGFNTWMVAAEASRFVPVGISGLGGDELFAGYSHFGAVQKARRDKSALIRAAQVLAQRLGRKVFGGPLGLSRLVPLTLLQDRIELSRRLIGDAQLSWLVRPEWWTAGSARRIHDESVSLWRSGDDVQKITYFEIYGYLVNMLLRDSDVLTMCHSLELRPFILDHKLAEFAYSLPAGFKHDGQTSKRILREAVGNLVPEEVVRRCKVGFGLPCEEWMNSHLNPYFASLLDDEWAKALLRPVARAYLKMGMRRRMARRAHWSLFVMLAWLRTAT